MKLACLPDTHYDLLLQINEQFQKGLMDYTHTKTAVATKLEKQAAQEAQVAAKANLKAKKIDAKFSSAKKIRKPVRNLT